MKEEASCEHSPASADDEVLKRKLDRIGHTFVVLSGKGGVGKSTVAVNLSVGLSLQGFRTGILDTDLHGPSVPKLLGMSGRQLEAKGEEMLPLPYSDRLSVISIGLLLGSDSRAVIWRGPMKAGVIRQFFANTAWGDLDALVVDCPPGTGDEPLSVAQLLPVARSSAIVVTTPQQVATIDVEKSITFCRELGLPIAGIVENMSGFICPHCGKESDVFSSGGGRELAEKYGVPFLGAIPLDPDVARSGDFEVPYVKQFRDSTAARKFDDIVAELACTLAKK
jgi:ATP-binding protein involved in chromosome partitioning